MELSPSAKTNYTAVKEQIQQLRLPVQPPTEAETVAWLLSLSERDQSMVRFLSTLQAKSYQVSIEELKIAGQTT